MIVFKQKKTAPEQLRSDTAFIKPLKLDLLGLKYEVGFSSAITNRNFLTYPTWFPNGHYLSGGGLGLSFFALSVKSALAAPAPTVTS